MSVRLYLWACPLLRSGPGLGASARNAVTRLRQDFGGQERVMVSALSGNDPFWLAGSNWSETPTLCWSKCDTNSGPLPVSELLFSGRNRSAGIREQDMLKVSPLRGTEGSNPVSSTGESCIGGEREFGITRRHGSASGSTARQ